MKQFNARAIIPIIAKTVLVRAFSVGFATRFTKDQRPRRLAVLNDSKETLPISEINGKIVVNSKEALRLPWVPIERNRKEAAAKPKEPKTTGIILSGLTNRI
jgi:hypothetical protein